MTTGWGARRPGRCTTGVAPPNASAAEEKARDMAAGSSLTAMSRRFRGVYFARKKPSLNSRAVPVNLLF